MNNALDNLEYFNAELTKENEILTESLQEADKVIESCLGFMLELEYAIGTNAVKGREFDVPAYFRACLETYELIGTYEEYVLDRDSKNAKV